MSPRPKKRRNCLCPHRWGAARVFKPAGTPLRELASVDLGHDEWEALQLCDGQGLNQEQAGARLGVSRGTVQRLLASGRKKLVEAVGEGRALVLRPPEH